MFNNKQKKIKNEKGFTLVEVMVVVFIFSLVIVVTVDIFTAVNKSQRDTLEKYVLQKEGAYLMETMSRELRMARHIDNSQKNLNGSEIEFTNYEGDVVTYCRADINGVCDTGGNYISRQVGGAGAILNSSKIKVSNFNIYTSVDFTSFQHLITIGLNSEYNGGYHNTFYLQTSVSLRIY